MLIAVVVLIAVGALVVWLFTEPTQQKSRAAAFDECRKGIVMSATDKKLVLRTDAGAVRTYVVRGKERVALDIPHMRQHASLGQSTLIYSAKLGNKHYAVRSDDAPLDLSEVPPCKR